MWSIIHGGAKTIEPADEDANRKGCARAVRAGRDVLAAGGSSIDAVLAAVKVLEDDPTFNAGYGSVLNAHGEVETCAALMEGSGYNVGAVAVAQGIRNPIEAARAMLHEEPVLIAGDGARLFAGEAGVPLCDPADLIPPGERSKGPEGKHDTVGAVALDAEGRIATAVSTGGVEGKPPGRVGDSPQPGCGFYADDRIGGVVFSGDGEHIARRMLAAGVMHALGGQIAPDEAVRRAIGQLEEIGGEAGGVLLTPLGHFGWAHNSSHFAVALACEEEPEPRVYLKKDEDDRP
ncbi:isoaspartyl peptidase/L-asparaginase family protein [Gellertiella hungarica]|uniref:Beta-aspartyl-peptidase (Threonine type) n=1 Tax=Gellertiella hungarica TaxID=1572859 RepID=A0A7W6J763_9HYPH|nr:isoaspartyl peptidase/L-asparaginase family protein [Gellertiella hungarica]MBB4066059.1 beta-aspartyl-peptidase (threonine type) [Gellertiella hungarica]